MLLRDLRPAPFEIPPFHENGSANTGVAHYFTKDGCRMHFDGEPQGIWYRNPMKGPRRAVFVVSTSALFVYAFWLSAFGLSGLWLLTPSAVAQDPSPKLGQELVANLAAGRVVIAVVKDAILIGTVENPIEAETRLPAPVEIETSRVGIILGPIDWFSPSSQQQVARLDRELPHLKAYQVKVTPHLTPSQGGDEASDIEATGQGLQQRLNEVAKGLHARLHLPENEPLAELIVADYLNGYGAEVWQLNFGFKQEQQKGDYWETRVLKPTYTQFWPPEKGQPKTLVEFNYPPENAPASLLELLRQKDPRLEKIRSSDAQMALVATELLQGESTKLYAADTTQFLRAALAAIAGPKSRQSVAMIGIEKGFSWILPPPAEEAPPRPLPAQAEQQRERPADAPPSLLKH